MYLFIYLFIYSSIYLFVSLFVCLFVYLRGKDEFFNSIQYCRKYSKKSLKYTGTKGCSEN